MLKNTKPNITSRRTYDELLDQIPGKDPAFLCIDPLVNELLSYKHFCRSELNINFSVTDVSFLDYLKLFSKVRRDDKCMVQLGLYNFYYGTWKDFKKIKYPEFKPNGFMEKSWDNADKYFNTQFNTAKGNEQDFIFVTCYDGSFYFMVLGANIKSRRFKTLFTYPDHSSPSGIDLVNNERFYSECSIPSKDEAINKFMNFRHFLSTVFSGWRGPRLGHEPAEEVLGKIVRNSAWPTVFSKSVSYTLAKLYSPLETIEFYKRILQEAEVNLTNSKMNLLNALTNQGDQLEALKNKVASKEVFAPEQEEKWGNIEKNYSYEFCDIDITLTSYKEAELDIFALKHNIKRLRMKHNLSNPDNPI